MIQEKKNYRILFADNEELWHSYSRKTLADYQLTIVSSEQEAMEELKRNKFNLLITDCHMETRESGLNLLKWVRENRPGTGVIMITAYAEIPHAVNAMKNGAMDYLAKPFNHEEFKLKVEKALERLNIQEEHRKHIESYNKATNDIIGNSDAIRKIKRLINIYAASDATVLLTGETGVGKGLVAKSIHDLSSRRDNKFISVNISAVPIGTIKSELFGHVRGSFTGAVKDRTGNFELADRGTIFLDEIGEMDYECQKYLLHVLEKKNICRQGSNEEIEIDVKVIAGTNRDLEKAKNEGEFREDLYYRLKQLPLEIPPLRERKEDILPIAEYFLKVENEKLKKSFTFAGETKKLLKENDWPGNVRSLGNEIRRAVIFFNADHQDHSEITPEYFSLEGKKRGNEILKLIDESTLDRYHEAILQQLLDRYDNKRKVARILDVTEATIHNWCRKFGL